MNKIVLLLFLCLSVSLFAQKEVKKELETIVTITDAETYLDTKKSKKDKLIAFNEAKHDTKLAKALISMSVGGTKIVKNEFGRTHYKVIEKTNEPHYRVSYIFLDETKLDIEKIYELRKTILDKFENGVPFADLARKYSMSRNANVGGDSGWFKDGEMPEEIENEVSDLKHQLDGVYSLRVPSQNGYYIVLKTHRIKKIKEVKVLKVIDKNR